MRQVFFYTFCAVVGYLVGVATLKVVPLRAAIIVLALVVLFTVVYWLGRWSAHREARRRERGWFYEI
jgi:uncharacterized membrane protein YfcA